MRDPNSPVFYFLSKILDLVFTPLFWSLALLGAALLLSLWRPARSRWWRGCIVASMALLYLFSLHPVSNALHRSLEDTPSTFRADVTYDAVVLLGGMVDLTSRVEGPRSYGNNVDRLLAAYDLLRTGKAREVFVTGGHPDKQRPEAREAPTLARQLEEWGIESKRIVVDGDARNTYENAVNAAKVAKARGWKSVLLVTSAFHMARAGGCFRAAGLEVDMLPVDYRGLDEARGWLPRAEYLEESTHALRERAGRLVYRVRGYSR
ncbi:MAG: YdcF family protein [Myxococcota bacterium]